MSGDLDQSRDALTTAVSEAARARMSEAYALAESGPDAAVWDEVIQAAAADTPITVVEIARVRPDAAEESNAYLAAVSSATAQAGGEVFAVADILEPGTGDLLAYMNYADGFALLLTFPSRAAYLAALASDAWQAGIASRRAAVSEAVVLIAGENTIPPMARAMFGEPRPAAAFATPHVDGKSPEQLIDELLDVYPDGGADPSRRQLDVMMRFPGFRDQPVHYVNLYAFGDGSDPAVKGAEAHDAYNAAAMQTATAHGGYPLLRAAVEHRIVSEIPWSRVIFVRWPSLAVFTDMRLDPEYIEAQTHRVESAETYGNFITIRRDA